ncbi:hypothetical protein M8J77_012132 [Diaphorina citri]|nr:hypothetical protein M8J77_012132 [Diaphorina citri]
MKKKKTKKKKEEKKKEKPKKKTKKKKKTTMKNKTEEEKKTNNSTKKTKNKKESITHPSCLPYPRMKIFNENMSHMSLLTWRLNKNTQKHTHSADEKGQKAGSRGTPVMVCRNCCCDTLRGRDCFSMKPGM